MGVSRRREAGTVKALEAAAVIAPMNDGGRSRQRGLWTWASVAQDEIFLRIIRFG
jgi:hypothetical protein